MICARKMMLGRLQVLMELEVQDQKAQVYHHETCLRLSFIMFGNITRTKFGAFVLVVIELV